jgi:hypothetical protein
LYTYYFFLTTTIMFSSMPFDITTHFSVLFTVIKTE